MRRDFLCLAVLLSACSTQAEKAARTSAFLEPTAPASESRAVLPAPVAVEPARTPTRAPPRREPGQADLDPDNDDIVAPPEPVADCDARLEHLGVDLEHAALPISGGPRGPATCGAEQVVKYIRGPGLIRYSSPPVLTCTLALALARFENMLQLEAAAAFHAKVARIEHAGTYSCRKMSRFSHMVSEHSYANAIDIRSLRLDDGREISVVRHFGDLGAEPKTLEGQFLRRIARRAYDDAIFSVVLTPFFDALHRDHFHLDMARYRVDGTR